MSLLPVVARFRAAQLAAWPWFRDTDADAEERELEIHASTPGALLVTAWSGEDALIGCSSGRPLTDWPAWYRMPLESVGFSPRVTYAVGEMLWDAEAGEAWTGLWKRHEAHAFNRGGFEHLVVIEPLPADAGPGPPTAEVPRMARLESQGFLARTDLRIQATGSATGNPAESPPDLQILVKNLHS